MSYVKLFGSILDSSIWLESKDVKILWVTMLAMKDRDGLIEAALPGLARRAGLSISETTAALQVLLSPDPYSRTPDHDGRRVEAVAGGWQVLNHDLYREKMDPDEQREKKSARQARWRARHPDKTRIAPDVGASVDAGRRSETPEALSDAEAEHTPEYSRSCTDLGSVSPLSGDPDTGASRDRVQAPVDRSGPRVGRMPPPKPLHEATSRDVPHVPPPPEAPDTGVADTPWKRYVAAWAHMRDRHRAARAAGVKPGTPDLPSGFGSGVHHANLMRCEKLASELYGPDLALEKMIHVVNVAYETAVRVDHLDWFIPSKLWDPDSFARAMDTTLEAARRGSTKSRPGPTELARRELLELEAAERNKP